MSDTPADDRIRASFADRDSHSLAVPNFWRGAAISLVADGHPPALLGTIGRQTTDGEISIVPMPTGGGDSINEGSSTPSRSVTPGSIIEIDPNLEAPVLATRLLLGCPLDQTLPPLDVRLGTTRGTNALLTRSGAATALLVTKGFGDLLRIGEQDREDLFALDIKKAVPLTDRIVEVDERLDAAGNVLCPIDRIQLRTDLLRVRESGIKSLAICFLHAHVSDQHERVAAELARELGIDDISRSGEVAPFIKLVSRAQTATLDAYLNPILRHYVDLVWRQFGGVDRCRLRLMTSNGNLVAPSAFRGRDSILSGPAGGVVALSHVARDADAPAAIGLDMGGTSTDVSRYEGGVGRKNESRVAGVNVMTTMMDIQTVAAGGGSICDIVDGRLTVGPQSAGADPGPACYGKGGPLTITDVNLLLGRLPVDRFPFPLDKQASLRRLTELSACSPSSLREEKTIRRELGEHADIDQSSRRELGEHADIDAAEGFLQIAVTHMAEAVRAISTAQGSDVRQMALVGFGGAAGGHLCRVADELQIGRILDHPDASVLSAVGIGLAEVGRVVSRGIYKILNSQLSDSLPSIAVELQNEAAERLRGEAGGEAEPTYHHECEVRFVGTESGLTIPLDPVDTAAERFVQKHRSTFGYAHDHRECELVSLRCEAKLRTHSRKMSERNEQLDASASPRGTTPIYHEGRWVGAGAIDRESLRPQETIDGPAMIVSDQSTLLVEPGWTGNVRSDRTIELRPSDVDAAAAGIARHDADDPVLLEVIARRLQGIADAMGEVLRRTAVSVNVKERRDYSCAVFRGDGSLVANAPHVPVHLGAMGHTVRQMIRHFDRMSPGDCYLSNDPFAGGSHLPDVTVVTPVFCESGRSNGGDGREQDPPDFFVASRAHHAEIGGRTPGSMPPDATSLAEEGVVLRNLAIVRDAVSHEDQLRQLLSGGRYPSRNVAENLADIAAQQAAGTYGADALRELAGAYSVPVIDSLMGRLLDVAGQGVANWIQRLPHTPMRFDDALDDGTPITVRLQRTEDRLSIDFSGTAPVHPGGFNATPSIVTAAVLYVLRCVSGSNLPLCDGVLRQIDLTIPPGLLNPPAHDDPAKCAAVVAGNVETSQRIVDVLLGALGAAAASQGTMNNLLIGDETFGYYETIGGGSGATADAEGADAVHTHMTNTRITDPEVLESRLPVRLHRFQVRTGSGGEGTHKGGDGIIRELEFLKPLTVSLITGRRARAPYGMAGGMPGACGVNRLIRGGNTVELSPTATFDVSSGDRLILETPGGGGWGEAGSPSESGSGPPPGSSTGELNSRDTMD